MDHRGYDGKYKGGRKKCCIPYLTSNHSDNTVGKVNIMTEDQIPTMKYISPAIRTTK